MSGRGSGIKETRQTVAGHAVRSSTNKHLPDLTDQSLRSYQADLERQLDRGSQGPQRQKALEIAQTRLDTELSRRSERI